MLKTYGDIDSKFKFVLVASKRAKQLLKGSKPKIKSKSKNLIRIALQEVIEGLVDYEIVQKKRDEEYKPEDENFIGEEIGGEGKATKKEIKRKPEEAKEEKVKSKSPGKKKQSKKKKQEKS